MLKIETVFFNFKFCSSDQTKKEKMNKQFKLCLYESIYGHTCVYVSIRMYLYGTVAVRLSGLRENETKKYEKNKRLITFFNNFAN